MNRAPASGWGTEGLPETARALSPAVGRPAGGPSRSLNVGIVSWWFNRGQATVARQLRSAIDELGHRTFVLARPTRARFTRPRFVAQDDVWDQPAVTRASHFEIPWREYARWARENDLDAIFFDQNYQFKNIARLSALGIRTIGRFV